MESEAGGLTRMERLEVLRAVVGQMRIWQLRVVAGRQRRGLSHLIRLEKECDRLLAELKLPEPTEA